MARDFQHAVCMNDDIGRIFCIGRNYAAHIEELGNSPDSGCVVFMKPVSALVAPGEPIRLPRGRGETHHEAELVVSVTGGGFDVPVESAYEWIAGITLGLDLTLRDLQRELKKNGQPWELAKSFDGSAPLGNFRPYNNQDLQNLQFECRVNREVRQRGDTSLMLYPVFRLINILSQSWALQPGDVIFTGTPAGVGPLNPGDTVELSSPQLGPYRWTCE